MNLALFRGTTAVITGTVAGVAFDTSQNTIPTSDILQNVWGQPTAGVSAQIELVARSPLQVAPEGFRFKVTLTGFDAVQPVDLTDYDPTHHGPQIFWNFGDPGATWTAPVNTEAWQKDANKGYGPTAAHVYESTAPRVVSVLVLEASSGKIAYAEYRIGGTGANTPAIKDPDVVYPDGQTIIVDTNDVGLPAYPNAIVTTTPELAVSYCDNRTGPFRIMLMDDQEWTTSVNMLYGSLSPEMAMYRSGTGTAKPKLIWGGDSRMFRFVLYDPGRTKSASFVGIVCEGGWDSTTEVGNNGHSCFVEESEQSSYFLMHDCEIRNFGAHAYVSQSAEEYASHRFFSNSISEGHRSYHFFDELPGTSSYLGVRGMSNINALSGGGRNGNHNDAAIVRNQRSEDCLADGCDIFVRTGWFENAPFIITAQSAWRFDQRGTRGARVNMQRCSIEGSLSINRTNQDYAINVQNNLIERNVFMGTAWNGKIIEFSYTGLTIRNNWFIVPNVERLSFFGAFNPNYFLGSYIPNDAGAQTGNVAETIAGPVDIYSNTFISMMDAVNGTPPQGILNESVNGEALTNLSVYDNVLYAGDAAVPQDAQGPLGNAPAFTPRYNGYRAMVERVDYTLASDVLDGASVTIPYPSGRVAADYAATPAEDHRAAPLNSSGAPTVAISAVTVVFNASDFTVTNNSGSTWPAGAFAVGLFCPDSPTTYGNYASPSVLNYPAIPQTGSNTIGAATGAKIGADFFADELRAASETVGAFEPA